jgi:hypothetical protein
MDPAGAADTLRARADKVAAGENPTVTHAIG